MDILDIIPTNQEKFSDTFSHFLKKTSTAYSVAPLSYLLSRGIKNSTLDGLLKQLPNGAIIAGGYALSVLQEDNNATDIDFFFTSEEAFTSTYNLLTNKELEETSAYHGYTLKEDLSEDQKARYVSFTHPTKPAIQLIKMVWYTDAAHVIDSFDFTISQFAFTNTQFVFNGLSILDLARKRLVLHRMQFPASTLRRIIKYTHKGYYICPGSLVTVCEHIQGYRGKLDVNDVVYLD